MGNSRQLMVIYSNIECFNSLGSTFDVVVWGSLKAGRLYKRLREWRFSLRHWLSWVFQRGRLVRRYRGETWGTFE